MAFLGALEILHQKGILRNVKEYVGISAGAFMAFGLVLGYSIQEIKKLCMKFDFSLIRSLEPESAIEFFDSFGLDNGENLQKLLESLLKQKNLPTDITFAQFSNLRPDLPRLRCFATDICTSTPREFSAIKSPDTRLTEALRATMSLTFYFTPVMDSVTGHYLTDGGVLHNYPMAFLTPEERQESLGLMFSNAHVENKDIHDFFDFMGQLFACIYVPRTRKIYNETSLNTIVLPKGDYPAWNFEATEEEKVSLMEAAAKATVDYLATYQGNKPMRRFSVG